MIPGKLYKAYSFVEDHPDLGNVCFAWVYHLREKPVAPYEDLIEGYDDLDEMQRRLARRDVNEMFTDQEVEALGAYLENEHGFESFLIENPLPLRLDDLRDKVMVKMASDTPGAIYLLSDEPGYNLPFEAWAYFHLLDDWETEKPGSSDIIEKGEEKIVWLAREIFTAFPRLVTGLKFYILDCGCIYYRRRFVDGTLVSKAGIYRDAADGPCEICMTMDERWKDRVLDETVVYNCGVEIAKGGTRSSI